ncbi:MAG: sigma-70 family RNA polymerase sigma factor [Candidatus Omnitrophica bacterium]|nr:sigma-70 family RNA polymerase sigma factor [Candidatus Omnitrophota bacterium]
MTKNAEATLVSQVLNGRRECYRPLVEKYQMKIYLLACSMLGNPSEAQDIAQETFLVAYKSLNQLKDQTKFGSWLFGITRNLCYSAMRRQKIKTEPIDSVAYQDIPNVVPMRPSEENGVDILSILMKRLDDLPEKYRVLLRLKYLEDYSYQEISEMLDIPVDLVRSRLFEGRRLLREDLDNVRRIANEH